MVEYAVPRRWLQTRNDDASIFKGEGNVEGGKAAADFMRDQTTSKVSPGFLGLSGVNLGQRAPSPSYHHSPKGSCKHCISPRWRIIHSKAVEVERGVDHSTRILCIFYISLLRT